MSERNAGMTEEKRARLEKALMAEVKRIGRRLFWKRVTLRFALIAINARLAGLRAADGLSDAWFRLRMRVRHGVRS